MPKYKLKEKYRKNTTIALSNGVGYRINHDFFNAYPNAEVLIQERKEIGHFFEHLDGKPVNDAEKPVVKEPKAKASEKAKPSPEKD